MDYVWMGGFFPFNKKPLVWKEEKKQGTLPQKKTRFTLFAVERRADGARNRRRRPCTCGRRGQTPAAD